MRRQFISISILIPIAVALAGLWQPGFYFLFIILAPLIAVGYFDISQKSSSIRRNFPVIGHFRGIFESIRPEIHQYFVEGNDDGMPFNRLHRSVIYQRAKKVRDTLPFGTQKDVYAIGYEWANHSLKPIESPKNLGRIRFGGPLCQKPYDASLFNISAMSYGALSKQAILALNGGAKDGNFAHNTGEGGISPYHLEPGGDLIWEIGTGYFSCRDENGNFSPEKFRDKATLPQVKMIELKMSQGAKPGHGGILPGAKVTQEIADIRNIPIGKDCVSPPYHKEFSSPSGMLAFIHKLRELSGGKPVGFKLCLGKRREFMALCKAMVKDQIYPDYIVVDGGEGGTGAAPPEFSDHIGAPLIESLVFVHNCLTGFGLRPHIKIAASGKIKSGFDIVKIIALGADTVYSARGMMMALGCIQALRCNSNHCPTGVATQDPQLSKGLNVPNKRQRVRNFQHETLKVVGEFLGAMGLNSTSELRPWHIVRRTGPCEIKHYGEVFHYIPSGCLLTKETVPQDYIRSWDAADPDTFDARPEKPEPTVATHGALKTFPARV